MTMLNFLGGLGQGVMTGAQFVQQKNVQDEQLRLQREQAERNNRFNEARLGVLNEEMAQKKAERERVKSLTGVYQKYGDKDWTDPATFEALTREALPHMKAEEVAAVQQQSAALRKVAGADAVNRFVYAGDLSGFQGAIDRRMPGAKLADEGGMLTITRPDGSKRDFTDAKGLAAMFGMSDALERLQAIDAKKAEGAKAQAELDNKRADTAAKRALAGYRDRMPNAAGRGAGGSRAPAGAGGQAEAAPTYAALGFKNQKELVDWLAKGIPEAGLAGRDANGREVSIAGDQLLRDTETNLDLLLGSNTKLSPLIARDIALSMAQAKVGIQSAGGIYTPTPQLNTVTGRWETAVRSGDKVVARVPSAVVEPTPEQVFKQESSYASRLSDQIGARITELAKDPEGREALMIGLRDPAAMAVIEAKLGIPSLARKLELLYGYTSLSRYTEFPDPALQAKRAEVLRTRDALAKKTRSPKKRNPTFSDEEKAVAARYGVDADQKGLGEYIAQGARAVSGWVGKIASQADRNFVENTLKKIHGTGRIEPGDAKAIVARLREQPRLREAFSDDEIWAIQVAANKRI